MAGAVLSCAVAAWAAEATTIFAWDFEGGMDPFYTSDGLWECGVPSSGLGTTLGSACVGVILNGNYPYGPDSRLIGPGISLPVVGTDEEIVLWIRDIWSYSSSDFGKVQIATWDSGTSKWSEWIDLSTVTQYTPTIRHRWFDLTKYAGQRVRICFYHEDNTELDGYGRNIHAESSGWYVDDVEIIARPIPFFWGLEDFESGWNEWIPALGIWEVGTPASGPKAAYSGVNAAATVLGGNYPYGPDSRLVSPQIKLPEVSECEELLLRFRDIWSYASSDKGEVQVTVYDEATGAWSAWEVVSTITSYSWTWRHGRVNLTAYAGRRIRVAFSHVDGTELDGYGRNIHAESTGWYIDDIEVFKQQIPYFDGSEDFESGWDGWFADLGNWQVGKPSSGPGGAHGGTNCAGMILGGNYPYGPDSRLVSPLIRVPVVEGFDEVVLRFWDCWWYASSDAGYVQINVYDPAAGAWSGWTTLDSVVSANPVWRHARIDLTPYAGKLVRICFYHVDNTELDGYGRNIHAESAGWYIDDVTITPSPIASCGGGETTFRRGDANTDGRIDVSDAISILMYLFVHESLSCLEAADANDNNLVEIADAIYLVSYLFARGAPPAAPFGACGIDLTPGNPPLGCEAFPPSACP